MKALFTFVVFIPLLLNAQADSIIFKRIETSLKYSIQCPIYSVNTPNDLSLSQDTRYRSRVSVGIKYYPGRRWYAEYLPSFSQQGGGYKNQKTNANYFTNSFLLGYSTLHSKRLIFNLFCGIEANMLINARFINTQTNEIENVSSFFNGFYLCFPFGMGIKTKIASKYYIGVNTFFSLSPYRISKEPNVKVSQLIFPAFQFSLSRFLK